MGGADPGGDGVPQESSYEDTNFVCEQGKPRCISTRV
jgi:hypothetical protein